MPPNSGLLCSAILPRFTTRKRRSLPSGAALRTGQLPYPLTLPCPSLRPTEGKFPKTGPTPPVTNCTYHLWIRPTPAPAVPSAARRGEAAAEQPTGSHRRRQPPPSTALPAHARPAPPMTAAPLPARAQQHEPHVAASQWGRSFAPGGGQWEREENAGCGRRRAKKRGAGCTEERCAHGRAVGTTAPIVPCAGWARQGTSGAVVLAAPRRAASLVERWAGRGGSAAGPHGGGDGADGRAGARVSAVPRLHRRPEAAGRGDQGGPREGLPGERGPRPLPRGAVGRPRGGGAQSLAGGSSPEAAPPGRGCAGA